MSAILVILGKIAQPTLLERIPPLAFLLSTPPIGKKTVPDLRKKSVCDVACVKFEQGRDDRGEGDSG